MLNRILVATMAVLFMFVFAQPAAAANFCVGSSPTCSGSPVADFDFDEQGIVDAVNAANASIDANDAVLIAEGAPIELTSWLQLSPAAGVTIQGAGVGKTVFTSSIATSSQIYFNFANAAGSASGFTINVTGTVSQATGLAVAKGTLSDVEVNETGGTSSNFRGVSIVSGGTLEDSSIQLASSGSSGILTQGGAATATNVSIDGPGAGYGINASVAAGAPLTFSRLNIKGFGTGVFIDGGDMTLSDSLIDMGAGASNVGVRAFNNGNSVIPINTYFNRLTIVGTGNNQKGMSLGAGSPSGKYYGESKDLLLYGAGTNFVGQKCESGASAVLPSVIYNDVVATSGPLTSGADCSIGYNTKIDLAVDPGFRDFAGGDYRLKWNSSLIDLGTSTGTLDLAGDPRVVDGDADGTAKADLGAYEYQRSAPTVTIQPHKTTIALFEPITFTADATDPDGEDLTYAWTIDGVPSLQNPQALGLAFNVAGLHTVSVAVTDEAGATDTATTTVQVDQGHPACPAVLWGLTLKAKPKKPFTRTGKGFAAPKKGKAFFTLGIASGVERVQFTLQSVSKSKKLKTVQGSQIVKVSGGSKKFGFGGRFGGKNLKPGKYKVTATPLPSNECPPTLKATVTITLK